MIILPVDVAWNGYERRMLFNLRSESFIHGHEIICSTMHLN